MKGENKVLDVLVEIVRALLKENNKNIEEAEKYIVEQLINKGYKVDEINDLLDEVFQLMNIVKAEESSKIRILTAEEFMNFEESARDYLIFLKNSMIISEMEFEEALAVLSHKERRNTVIDIKSYLKLRGINTDITIS